MTELELFNEKISDVLRNKQKYLVKMYFLLENETDKSLSLKIVDLEPATNLDLKEKVLFSVEKNLQDKFSKLVNISDYVSVAENCLFKYDYEEDFPDKLNKIQELIKQENENNSWSVSKDFKNIKMIIFKIESSDKNIYLFRERLSINTYKNSRFMLFRDHNRFKKSDNTLLNIDFKIELIYIDNTFYFSELKWFERFFDFEETIKIAATKSLETIKKLNLLSNADDFSKNINDIKFAKKLAKIKTSSPVFELPSERIIKFSKEKRFLKSRFKYSDDDKIIAKSKKAQMEILKLLNDDFLHSQLTDIDYESDHKTKIIV